MNGEDQALIGYFEQLLIPPDSTEADSEVRMTAERRSGERFQVQPFRVGKLRFAALMEQLSGVLALESEVIWLPGQPGWASGRVSVAGRELWAASPIGVIAPGLRMSGPFPWVLLPRSGELALLCHEVEEPCWWRAEKVRWRTERVSRPWLIGMQADPPCPLIDVEQLVQEIKR
ncbi:MAG: hypothetical protein ACK4JF_03220 [Methylohalobius sp.]